jgi:tRNA dimethylallyltransferase
MMTARPSLPIICGPTASGKTALSLRLAEFFPLEIVSADSRQVYRLMDIGTAKPDRDQQQRVPHHLIDVVWPDEAFNASLFAGLARSAIADICKRQRSPLLVGGTGLYVRALTEGLLRAPGADPDVRRRLSRWADEAGCQALHGRLSEVDPVAAEKLHPNDRTRVIRALEVFEQTGKPLSEFQAAHRFSERPYRVLKLGLAVERSELDRRIDARSEQMFETGLLTEVEQLLARGYDEELKSLKTIGYRQAIQVLRGQLSREDAIFDLQRATRRYARQQMTWLRQDKAIKWVDSFADFDTIRKFIDDFYVN